jgi:adenylate cyclase
LTRSTTERLRLLALLVLGAAAAGGLYSLVQAPPGLGRTVALTTGAAIGAVISGCVIGFELFGADRLDGGGRRLPLPTALALRLALYGPTILAALLLLPWLVSGQPPFPLRPGILGDIAFSLAATFVFVSLSSIVQLIGLGTLGNLLTARYYRPRQEQRIVLFLDMVGATDIAERIGDVRFYAMLSDAFSRLARIVTDHGGEVHRYVGDALIATWKPGSPEKNGRAVRCLFACRDALAASAAAFRTRHGHLPDFRAGLHAGPVVAGEIGGFKREIALVGDTMNTAARIEQACRATGHATLASKTFLDGAALPPDVVATSLGTHRLRGKSEELELFALDRGAPPPG